MFGRRGFIGVYSDRKVIQDYDIVHELGEGSFAQVNLGVNKRTGVKEVVKQVRLDPNDPDLNDMIKNEIEILMKCVSSMTDFNTGSPEHHWDK